MKEKTIDEILLSAQRIQQRNPEDWKKITGYIRKQAYAVRLDAESEELVKAEYHRKSMATQILRKFGELDNIEE
jgi:hypothetical protein